MMSNKFNPLLLHSVNDIHPRTWICLKTPKIKSVIKDLEKDILKKQNWSREKLCREIGIRLNCAHTTIKRILQRKRVFYPIPVILELLKLSGKRKYFLKKIQYNITYLKVNSASAKPVKAIKGLNRNLAKILGAFMADGSLSIQVIFAASQHERLYKIRDRLSKLQTKYSTGRMPSRKQYYISTQLNKNNLETLNKLTKSHRLIQTHYNIELSEEYKDSVKAFTRWVKEEFNINPNRFDKKRNAWRVCFSNKILARYLTIFFNVIPGPKSYSAFEPIIIEKSNLLIRKEFAKGVLMFDGSVSKKRNISLGIVSYNLFSSIKQIWIKDNIQFGESIQQRKNHYNKKDYQVFTLFTTSKNKKVKLLQYFESGTQKWKLMKWLWGDLKQSPVIKDNSRHTITLNKLLKTLKRINVCDVNFLKKQFNRSDPTIRTYLKILEAQKKIKLSNKPKVINNCIDKNTMIFLKNRYHKLFFTQIRKKFKKDKNFAEFLGIHKTTMSAWRTKNNRIPINVLKEMCKILELDDDKFLKNILKTNRKIIEII